MTKEKETKKAMTIDDLALMVAKGFNETNERMDKRFEQVDKRFEQVDRHFEEVNKQLRNIKADLNKKVDKIDHNTLIYRVEKLEKNFA